MHRAIVLLEGETLPLSEVLSALEQVFIKYLSVLCSIRLCRPVPAAKNHPHSMMLFLSDVTLGIQAK
jgi:hypothetical protein